MLLLKFFQSIESEKKEREAMRISELVEELKFVKKYYGDLDVRVPIDNISVEIYDLKIRDKYDRRFLEVQIDD